MWISKDINNGLKRQRNEVASSTLTHALSATDRLSNGLSTQWT
jgi:hypothetical protein